MPTLLAGGTFLIFLLIHFSVFHFCRIEKKTRSITLTFLSVIPVYLVGYFITASDPLYTVLIDSTHHTGPQFYSLQVISFLAGLMLLGFLFLGHLEFFYTAGRSMTFRMLTLLHEHPMPELTSENFLELYDTNRIIQRRLDDMTYGGYLVEADFGYQLTSKGQRIQTLYAWVINSLNLSRFQMHSCANSFSRLSYFDNTSPRCEPTHNLIIQSSH